jgi:hypothetical protein
MQVIFDVMTSFNVSGGRFSCWQLLFGGRRFVPLRAAGVAAMMAADVMAEVAAVFEATAAAPKSALAHPPEIVHSLYRESPLIFNFGTARYLLKISLHQGGKVHIYESYFSAPVPGTGTFIKF